MLLLAIENHLQFGKKALHQEATHHKQQHHTMKPGMRNMKSQLFNFTIMMNQVRATHKSLIQHLHQAITIIVSQLNHMLHMSLPQSSGVIITMSHQ